jgi:D-alanyl-D-alanine carboxypeptidase
MNIDMNSKVRATLEQLGAAGDLAERRNLPLFADATELEIAHVSASGREHLLIPKAAVAWRAMRDAAADDGVTLLAISGYRAFDRQVELIQVKLERGELIDDILEVMAPPGCSEHHSGRAVDVGTPGCEPLSETFEQTDAFAWLERSANAFGFWLSYPRGNESGFTYEPWHWCHRPTGL